MTTKLPPQPESYQVDGFPLNKGLNFKTAPTFSESGELQDVLNYSQTTQDGLKRINGFIKTDGSNFPIEPQIYYVFGSISAVKPVPVGTPLYVNNNTVPFGLCVGVPTVYPDGQGAWFYIAINPKYGPVGANNETIYTALSGGPNLFNPTAPNVYSAFGGVSAIFPQLLNPSVPTAYNSAPEELVNTAIAVSNAYQKQVSTLGVTGTDSGVGLTPQGQGYRTTNVNGVFQVKDKKYLAIDSTLLKLRFLKKQFYPGDYIISNNATTLGQLAYGSTASYVMQVLKATLLTGSWTGGLVTDTAFIEVMPIMELPNGSDYNTYNPYANYDTTVQGKLFNAKGPRDGAYIFLARDYSLSGGIRYAGINYDPGSATYLDNTYLPTTGYMCSMFSEEDAANYSGIQSHTVLLSAGGSGYSLDNTTVTTNGAGTGGEFYPLILSDGGTGPIQALIRTSPGSGYSSSLISGSTTAATITSGSGSSASNPTWYASDWRYCGIRPINTGWKVPFTGGTKATNYLTTVDRRVLTQTIVGNTPSTPVTAVPYRAFDELDFNGAIQPSTNGSTQQYWTPSAGTVASCVQSSADATYLQQPLIFTDASSSVSATGGFQRLTPSTMFLNFSSLDVNIPDDAQIRGIEVTVSLETTAGWTVPAEITTYKLRSALVQTSNAAAQNAGSRTETRMGDFKNYNIPNLGVPVTKGDVTLGSSTDLWGNGYIKKEDLTSDNFGVALDIEVDRQNQANNNTTVYVRIHGVTIKVYYDAPSVRYYFANAGKTEVILADLLEYNLSSGSFRAADAVGEMIVVNARPIKGQSHTIKSGYTCYRDSGLTEVVATVSSDWSYNGVPSYKSLLTNKSRYQFVPANFYGNSAYDAIYVASGAGRAFEFNGQYLCPIYAYSLSDPDSSTKDIPRHIEESGGRLWLGYSAGNVTGSVPGEPLDFSGFTGAIDIGVGDRVTGLSKLVGNTLAVFCQSKIARLDVSGALSMIAPKVGVVEYSVQNIGVNPIFCTSSGIKTVGQTADYGDFTTVSISSKVDTWLLPRLNNPNSKTQYRGAGALVASYVSRTDGHYRLWFNDGYQLWVRVPSDLQSPAECTFVRYVSGSHATNIYSYGNLSNTGYYGYVPVVPIALGSFIKSSGEEEKFFSVENLSGAASGIMIPGVFKLDCSYGFDVGLYQCGIPAYVKTNYFYAKNPYAKKTLKKIRVEALSNNIAELLVLVGKEYEALVPYDYYTSGVASQPICIPNDYTALRLEDYKSNSNISSVSKTGRILQMLFVNVTPNPYTGSLAYFKNSTLSLYTGNIPFLDMPTPPHILQAVLVQFEEGRPDA